MNDEGEKVSVGTRAGASAGVGGGLTREELIEGVARLGPWFQLIDLGGGVLTKTASVSGEEADHPRGEWEVIRRHLPEDFSGKSVLDVGCNAGFFSFEAARRGAARVVGVDAQRHHVRQALFARRALGLEAEFRRLSVYDLSPRGVGRFDVTLALGLVYHLKHLVLALENLYRVTRALLIVESAIYPTEKRGLLGGAGARAPESARGLPVHLLAYVENAPGAKEAVYNWFLPSVGALTALLRNVGFDEVYVDQYNAERAVFVCRKTRERADSSRQLEGLRASLALEEWPEVCRAGEEVVYRLRVENTGDARWLAAGADDAGKGAVHLGAHLLRADGEEETWDYGRGALESDLDPGESAPVEIRLRAPVEPGAYLVEFDMVSEQLAWFEDLGSQTLSCALRVKA